MTERNSPNERTNQDPEFTMAEYLDHDVTNAALHEAGHFLVARHLGIAVQLRLMRRQVANPEEVRMIKAQCGYEYRTNFQRCCIGWGGIVAESLWDDPDWSPEEFEMEALDDPEYWDISASDARSINSHCQKLRAAKVAYRVICSQREELKTIIAAARETLIAEKQNAFFLWSPQGGSFRTRSSDQQ